MVEDDSLNVDVVQQPSEKKRKKEEKNYRAKDGRLETDGASRRYRRTSLPGGIDGQRCTATASPARSFKFIFFKPSVPVATSTDVVFHRYRHFDRRRSPAMLVSHRRFLPFIAVLRRTSTSVDIVRQRSPATLVSHRRFLRFIAVSIVTQFFSSYIKII